MADFILQSVLSNLIVATIIAGVAWIIQKRFHSAALANLLWALVLLKLVTPPLVSLPVVTIPSVSPARWESTIPASLIGSANHGTVDNASLVTEGTTTSSRPTEAADTAALASSVMVGALFCLSVSLLLLFSSALRIVRFHFALARNSQVEASLSDNLSPVIARQLGLSRYPTILITTANIAPFVWWQAGRAVIVISDQARQQLSETDLRLVILHEMAHIKRRDHWFRWLEWTALVVWWWNPIMWIARRQLRISEEMACDNLVLQSVGTSVHQYATSLLNMAELLTATAIRPPVVASAINSGGQLEKRLKKMISNRTWNVPHSLRLVILAMAVCILPWGVVNAQDLEAIQRRLGGAVEAGEITLDQAKIMMDALRKSTGKNQISVKNATSTEKRSTAEMNARKARYIEFARDIEAAVKEGDLSKEDAERKLLAVRREMFEQSSAGKQAEDLDLEARERRFAAAERELDNAVREGKLSAEEAKKKLIDIRNRMLEAVKKQEAINAELQERKKVYLDLAKEVEMAIKAGKLSKEEAEEKLIDARLKLFPRADSEKKDLESKRRKYAAVQQELKAAVESGKMSVEAAEKKLIQLRRDWFDKD